MNPVDIPTARPDGPSGADGHSPRPQALRPERSSRAQHITEAVVANYIHAISTRAAQ
jgi:hypothetical protein